MSADKPNWMDTENKQAAELAETGAMENPEAGQMVRVFREPPRFQKAFYIQKKFAAAFDDLAYQQKTIKGKKAPQLIEEALGDLLKKYGHELP